MWNLSRSSDCHCSARCGGQSTHMRRTSPRSRSSRAMRHASTVLPMPTSSEIRIRQIEMGVLYLCERQDDTCFLFVCATEGAKHQEVSLALRENHPFTSACLDQ